MSASSTLLFLHGVGTGDLDDEWQGALAGALTRLGYPGLHDVKVLAPKYAHALRGCDDNDPLPEVSVKSPSGDAARRHLRDFERRTGSLEVLLGRHDRGTGWPLGDSVVQAAVALPHFEQASNYATNAQIRAQVLTRVLKGLPSSGRLMLVGHSLGSVIAADLVRRLPPDLEVTGMVTLGSPLASSHFTPSGLRGLLGKPPANLAWWVNFWNEADPVTAHKGVSLVFPWMIDHRIKTSLSVDVHDAVTYLNTDGVAAAVGYGLFGSRSKSLAPIETGVDIALDYGERMAVLGLQYAHLLREHLAGDTRDRYSEALRTVQAVAVDTIKKRNAEQGRPLPAAIAVLAVDLADPDSAPTPPDPLRTLSKAEAVVPLLSISAANVINPFEIEIPKEKRKRALEELTLVMGLGSQLGADVHKATQLAREEIEESHWLKWVVVGVGAATLLAATGGLALAATPGVAGAAAVTSALAAFGPGGMIGGLLTAGTLMTAGGGGIALGLASSDTSAATLVAVVETQLAAAILRHRQGLDQDPETWHGLVQVGIELRRERARRAAVSDDSSPTLKELSRKLEAVDRALKYLHTHRLGPSDLTAIVE